MTREIEIIGTCPHCHAGVYAKTPYVRGWDGVYHPECLDEMLTFDEAVKYAEDVDPQGFFRWLRTNREYYDEMMKEYAEEHKAKIQHWMIW